MLASIVSIQRSNSVFVVLLFLQHFFSSTRVQKEGVVDPNTVLSPNFAKIKGISSVLCAAYWWSQKKQCLGMSPLPRHKHRQPRISASLCQCLLPWHCSLPTCTPSCARGTRAPGALSLLGAGGSAEPVLNMSIHTVILLLRWKRYIIDW